MKELIRVLVLVVVVMLLSTSKSQATIERFGFYNITNNDPTDAAIGEAQLFVDVSDEFANQVLFTFRNTGPFASSISEIYFDNGALLSIADIINDPPNVIFVQGASPPELPGANLIDPPFEAASGLLFESVPPPVKKGVNPGEWVGMVFDLQPGATFQQVVNGLYGGTLRVGVHVIGFDSGGSESFVNVPEPATIVLLSLCGLVSLRMHIPIRARKERKYSA